MIRSRFRVAPLVALARADLVNIARDPLLASGAFMSLLPGVLLYFYSGALEQFGVDQFGYAGLLRAASAVVLMLPPALMGWIFGFLLLEDRDDNVLVALEITPLGKSGFMAYRVVAVFVLTLLVLLATLPLALPDEPPVLAFGLALVAALHAVTMSLFLVGFAANKVEGLALTKLLNIAILMPLIALAPAPWRWIAGIAPPFWIGEMLALGPQALPPASAFVLGLGTSIMIATLLYWRARRRVG